MNEMVVMGTCALLLVVGTSYYLYKYFWVTA